MIVNNIKITPETIKATRNWYADNSISCIKEAVTGEVRVNDIVSYVKWRKQQAVGALNGANDHTVSFAQMALYLQTGESIAILS